jgi:hypothetical protein
VAKNPLNDALEEPSGAGAFPDLGSDAEVYLDDGALEDATFLDVDELFSIVPTSRSSSPSDSSQPPRGEISGDESRVTSARVESASPEPSLEDSAEEWFEVGKVLMSGTDILLTIDIVEQMEAALVTCIERLLEEADIPGGVPPEKHGYRLRKLVPAPGGGERVIVARTKKDTVPAVHKRYLSRHERAVFRGLAGNLPEVLDPKSGAQKMTAFKEELFDLLSGAKVGLHELRTLLPIKESGSLKPLEESGGSKPPPRYEPVTSKMLKQKALDLGLMD